jgi:hypothetical protein
MRAVPLRWTAAVAVGQSICGPGEPVFDPLGVGGDCLGIEAEQPALDVHAGLAITIETRRGSCSRTVARKRRSFPDWHDRAAAG